MEAHPNLYCDSTSLIYLVWYSKYSNQESQYRTKNYFDLIKKTKYFDIN